MIQNQAGQVVFLEVLDLAGAPFAGPVTVYFAIDRGAEAIGSVGAGLATLVGHGKYRYLPAQGETNGTSITITGIGAGAAPASITYQTAPRLLQNQPGQTIFLEVMDLAGAPYSGAVTIYLVQDQGAEAIGSVGGGLMTLVGHGKYRYLPAALETNGKSITYTGIGVGAAPASVTYETLTLAQAQAFQTVTGSGVTYVFDLIRQALFGLNIYHANEPIKVADSTLALFWLKLIFDDWNLDPQASYAEPFTVFASTGANPETIGPSGGWVLPARPPAIQGVAVDIGSGQYREIFITDDPRWWAAQTTVLTGFPQGAYYEASEPNGKLYFNNLPAAATNIRLMLRTTFGRVALTDVLVLPPGYESALTLTLMEAIAEPLHATVSASLTARAGKARALIFSKNLRVPALSVRGLGLPGVSRGWWDYRTGTWRS